MMRAHCAQHRETLTLILSSRRCNSCSDHRHTAAAVTMKQSTLSFPVTRADQAASPAPQPIAPASLDNPAPTVLGKRRRAEDADDNADAAEQPPPRKRSATAEELAGITKEQALAALARLTASYRDKSGAGYPAAVSNEAGCILAQKMPNRAVSIFRLSHGREHHTDRAMIAGQRLCADSSCGGGAHPSEEG
jgi:hypothetical protein